MGSCCRIYISPYRDEITEFLGGGPFLFSILGSPDEQYGNTKDHVFRVYVVPICTVGVIAALHFYKVALIFTGTAS